ncbi:arylsulfatase [Gramella sp. AN32]|uniref:Arylsulfatase n=1 Tax=Christiangramia antarctica TaxID=2058158 RepID=A0ABW5X394_9FLAO|nr:arylsulfatase [Gramella sp. AN32]MCM4155784.1 arylsulfatase [Gramella sp. AN32]
MINFKTNYLLLLTFLMLINLGCKDSSKDVAKPTGTTKEKPNIVVIYMDDLGYGDLSSYGATEIETPNIDALANGGVKFTNAYATSATCTPSRYALLTGEYPWRNERARILAGDAPLLISPQQQTLPKLLSKAGYQTAIIGKWHLGLGEGDVNWNDTIKPGPNEVGFDESYIMAATQDRVPTVYIENGNVVGLDKNDPIQVSYKKNFEGEPTAKSNPEMLTLKWHHGHNNSIVNGMPRIGFMKGGEAAKWKDIDMADHFLQKAQAYVKRHKKEPFFLYYAMQQPHVPRTPHPRFAGKSGMGPRGDVILEADWCIGEFVKTLEDEGVLENTLIIFSSDNGPVLNDGYYDDAVEKLGDHDPKGGLRGGKYSLFEAGTRVPFITYWKGKITPGVSDAIVSQVDLSASLADFVEVEGNKTDSQNLMSTFLGKSKKGRDHVIIEANSRTALRSGDWLMIPPYKGNAVNQNVGIETGISSEYQLYNLKDDRSQQNNLAEEEPSKLEELVNLYENLLK